MRRTERAVVDPLQVSSRRSPHARGTREIGREHESFPHEVMLDPPVGADVMRVTVASTYRTPVPILFDAATRTAYPIRSDG